MLNRKLVGFGVAVLMAVFSGYASSASISASYQPAPTGISLGTFAAGTYTITASGVISLANNPSYVFDVDANGKPVSPVTYPGYAYFNPNGASYDGVMSNVGPGGAAINLGALMGTLSATPSAADWFLIGTAGWTVTLLAEAQIYAAVNDTYYSNNSGNFNVLVSQIPLPAAAWLFGSALFGLVAVARRRAVIA